MSSFALSVELFVVVFSFFSWLLTESRKVATVDNISSKSAKGMLETTDTRFDADINSDDETDYEPIHLPLTQEMIDEFNSFLEPQKVKEWALQLKEKVVSIDMQFCPFVQYLLSTDKYESVDINNSEHATFWLNSEIDNLSDSQLEWLDEVEKHFVDLPFWVSKAVQLFDKILAYRSVTGSDVVQIVDHLTGNDNSAKILENEQVSKNIEALNLIQLRKVASKLKAQNVIPNDTKLSGKGIGKKFISDLICDCLSTNADLIADVLTQVLNEA